VDDDGHGCDVDCDDGDPSVLVAPLEVSGLTFTTDGTKLQWDNGAMLFGSATVCDVVRGFSIGWLPGPDEAFWYLVRATNGCGIGTYGWASAGERETEACP
jgi:hypothetical protein